MKKNRKQTALAKCLLATIMAMGMMGYTTVWAEDTVTPSPIDKSVAMDKNGAGHIYDAKAHSASGYFWTDLGHAQVQIGSGEQIKPYPLSRTFSKEREKQRPLLESLLLIFY